NTATRKMTDTSQSAMEYQLATGLMCAGATDEEVVSAYHKWIHMHPSLKSKLRRFITQVVPAARVKTGSYIAVWEAQQPIRRKWGTTRQLVLDAIRGGHVQPKDIMAVTGLRNSAVWMQL